MSAEVLIVDDAAFMRMMLKDILTKANYKVVGEASNGKQAVEQYKKFKPELVTMDITMPEVNGIEALKAIKKMDPAAKVLMVSAMGQEKLIVESMDAGALDFIVKPFQPAKVVEVIKKIVGDQQKE